MWMVFLVFCMLRKPRILQSIFDCSITALLSAGLSTQSSRRRERESLARRRKAFLEEKALENMGEANRREVEKEERLLRDLEREDMMVSEIESLAGDCTFYLVATWRVFMSGSTA